jgi:superfamily II DNA or RNA helicase
MVNEMISHGGGVGVAGTGAGKTMMCAALAQSYEKVGCKTITIVPDKNLVAQTREEFIGFGLDTGEYSGDCKDIKHPHVVSTWQALQNNKKIIQEFNLVIVDECHGIKGQVLQEILNKYGKSIIYRFGVTGTLPKGAADQLAVLVTVGPKRFEITAAELIRQGWLAKLDIDVEQVEVNLEEEYKAFQNANPGNQKTYKKFKDEFFPDYSAEKSYLEQNKTRLEWIADKIIQKSEEKKGNVFCLVNSIKFGKKLQKMIPGSKFVYGQDKIKARREVYDLFKENDNLIVIATIHVASTGLNIKRIFNMMFIDVGKSFIRVIQTIGRGLRKAPDKDSVLVTDICSDLKYGKRHATQRIKIYKEAEYPYKKKLIKIQHEANDLVDF